MPPQNLRPERIKGVRYSASFSGGKDSTAMVLRLVEEDWPLDEIVFFDTGWEFPQMIEHVDRVERYLGRPITRLKPERDFMYWMLRRPIVAKKGPMKGKVHRVGNGWPHYLRRWCTREKVECINRHTRDCIQYIGFAYDERRRVDSGNLSRDKSRHSYPLIRWRMTEAQCLAYCRRRGFDWGGLYDLFQRVSCFCCPLQRIGELKTLRSEFPELWAKMLHWERQMGDHCRGFKGTNFVRDYEVRFAREEAKAA